MKNLLTALFIFLGYAVVGQVEAPPPPPPPPAPQVGSPEVFKVVEEMPRFPGCEDMEGTNQEIIECSKQEMSIYIYKNLKYPEEAKSNSVEGISVIQFRIEKDGTLSNIKAVRDPGAGTGQAAADVVHLMNKEGIKWIPGKQRGRKVIVQYTLPVKFKL